jgi:hypothetical protein
LNYDNAVALKDIANEAHHESRLMINLAVGGHRLSFVEEMLNALQETSTKDAASVKVLAIIGLIYLPTTIVSVSFYVFYVGFPTDKTSELLLNTIRANKLQRWNACIETRLAPRRNRYPTDNRHNCDLVPLVILETDADFENCVAGSLSGASLQ